MRVRGISWVGVKTGSYGPMREFFARTAGLTVDFERPDFVVFRRAPDGKVFGPVTDPAHP